MITKLRQSSFVALSLVCFFPSAEAAAQPTVGRPNILWLVSEDNSKHTVGVYGDPLARTPVLDRLARDGIVYRHAYSTAPVCAPCRSSIITGRYATSLGTQHMRSQRPLPADVGFFPALLRQAGYYTANNAKTDYNTSSDLMAATWDESSKAAHWRNRRPGQPFFAVFNCELSHESSLHKRRALLTDPAQVRVPAYLPDTPEVRADIAQYYDNVALADTFFGKILQQLEADGLAEDTIIFYYGDHGGAVSRSKRFLYENGTNPPLIVHFPEKYRHLAPAAPGTQIAELVNFVDLAPTVLSLAGAAIPAHLQGRAFAGPARRPAPGFTFMLRDRMDERYDLARAVTDGRFRYIRNYYPNLPWGQQIEYLWRQASMSQWAQLFQEGGLNATQRRFFEPKGPEDLYDCEADPDNVRNLARDPAYADQLARLRAALRAHQLAIRDTGFMPEPMMIALAAGRSPAMVSHDDNLYPLARILRFLDDAQLAPQPEAAAIQAALRAPEPMLRYWAAVAAQNAGLAAADLAPLLDDADPSVRLAAAEARLRREDDPKAWEVIARVIRQPALPEEQLFALNTLIRIRRPLPDSLRPMLVQLQALDPAAGEMNNYLARIAGDVLRAKL
jgi:arylsulfatase A-like enzyme